MRLYPCSIFLRMKINFLIVVMFVGVIAEKNLEITINTYFYKICNSLVKIIFNVAKY